MHPGVSAEIVHPVEFPALDGVLPGVPRAVVLQQHVQLDAHLAVLARRSPSEYPREHEGDGRPLPALAFALVPAFLDVLPDLLVELVQIIVHVVRPQIEVGELPRDIHALIVAQPVDKALIHVEGATGSVLLQHPVEALELKRHAFLLPEIFLKMIALRASNTDLHAV